MLVFFLIFDLSGTDSVELEPKNEKHKTNELKFFHEQISLKMN